VIQAVQVGYSWAQRRALMDPGALDSMMDPCLERVKYLKPFDIDIGLCEKRKITQRKGTLEEDEERDHN
jgi:hypothetical protein